MCSFLVSSCLRLECLFSILAFGDSDRDSKPSLTLGSAIASLNALEVRFKPPRYQPGLGNLAGLNQTSRTLFTSGYHVDHPSRHPLYNTLHAIYAFTVVTGPPLSFTIPRILAVAWPAGTRVYKIRARFPPSKSNPLSPTTYHPLFRKAYQNIMGNIMGA